MPSPVDPFLNRAPNPEKDMSRQPSETLSRDATRPSIEESEASGERATAGANQAISRLTGRSVAIRHPLGRGIPSDHPALKN